MSGMAAGTRECERLPRDLRCAERAGAEPREQFNVHAKNRRNNDEKKLAVSLRLVECSAFQNSIRTGRRLTGRKKS
jgi:hypothetical protein